MSCRGAHPKVPPSLEGGGSGGRDAAPSGLLENNRDAIPPSVRFRRARFIAAPCVLFVGEGWPGICPSSVLNAQAAPIPKGSLSVGDDSIPLRPVSPTDAGTTFRTSSILS